MAKIPGKNTLLKLETTSGVLVTVAQVFNITAGAQKSETVECDDHDNPDAGIPKGATGRSSQEDVTFEFYFSTHATHKFLSDAVQDPLTELPIDGEIVRRDIVASDFEVAGIGFGTSYPLNDYIKANGTLTISKLINYPTTA